MNTQASAYMALAEDQHPMSKVAILLLLPAERHLVGVARLKILRRSDSLTMCSRSFRTDSGSLEHCENRNRTGHCTKQLLQLRLSASSQEFPPNGGATGPFVWCLASRGRPSAHHRPKVRLRFRALATISKISWAEETLHRHLHHGLEIRSSQWQAPRNP
jgi:hypothetical protein